MRRPTETRLRRAFADVLNAAMATAGAAALASVGCGGTTATNEPGGGPGGPTPTFSTLCSGTSGAPVRTLLAGLHASPEIDGALTRSETAFTRTFPGQPGGVTASPETVGDEWVATNGERAGNLCGKASDVPACLAKVEGYRVLPPTREACAAAYPSASFTEPPRTCGTTYVIYTRGNEVGVARSQDEIKALIGTFDTVEEAMWLAGNAGYQTGCGGSYKTADSQYRSTQDGGWDLDLIKYDGCGGNVSKVLLHVTYDGVLTVVSSEEISSGGACSAGRRPAGLRLDLGAPSDPNAVGRHFAAMAQLEAASVTAFRRLHRQLAAYGAPRELLTRIRKAVRDEIRHARATTALAKKYGVTPAAPSIAPCSETPSLFAIALENAREGCVRETYGALVAHFQAANARDADVQSAMAPIADEETEHAALSWDIAAWIDTQLADEELALLAAERQDAFTTLARELAAQVDPRVQHTSGIPAARDAVRMLEGLAPVMLAAA